MPVATGQRSADTMPITPPEIAALVDRNRNRGAGAWVGGPSKVLSNRAALG